MTTDQLQCSCLMDSEDIDEGDDESVEAPPFSPLSVVDIDDLNLGGTDSGSEVSEGDKSDNVDDYDIDGGLHEHSTTYETLPIVSTTSAINSTSASNSTSAINSQVCNGYKVVVDNFDRNIRASYQRIDRTTESFHCVHFYAALDRIDFSGLSDTAPTQIQVDLNCLLPTETEICTIKEHFTVIIER